MSLKYEPASEPLHICVCRGLACNRNPYHTAGYVGIVQDIRSKHHLYLWISYQVTRDGKKMAVSGSTDKTVKIWNAATGAEVDSSLSRLDRFS